MGYSYDFEAAKTKLVAARDLAEERMAAWGGQYKDLINETAAAVNAPTFTSICQKACENIDADIKLFRDLVGQEGDEATDGTLYGAIKFAERGIAALGL